MSLDLGKSKDFATATLSSVSGILNQFAGLNDEQWDIQEGAYGHPPGEMVLFHVFKTSTDYSGAVDQIQDNISRRVIPFEFPYVDGQTTEDLGRNGEMIDFNIIIFGPHYYAAYQRLIKEFNDQRPGTLIHPVRGRITAKFKEATVTHKSTEKQAVTMHVRFMEHNFEVSFKDAKPTTKSALATAVGFIAFISNIVNKIESNLNVLAQIRALLSGKVSQHKDDYTQVLVSLNTTFNNGSSNDIPSLLPTNSGSGSTGSSAFPSAESPNDPFAGTTPESIQSKQSPSLAAAQATDQVKALRVKTLALIHEMEQVNAGQGSLIFYEDILTLKKSAIAMQKALELGLQSSNATIKNFKVPRLMTVREVCFVNGISVDRSEELITLNPNILSANYITAGTVMQVPSS